MGTRPADASDHQTTGSEERPETRGRLLRIPDTMQVVPAVLLAGALAVGVVPGFPEAVARAVDEAGSGGAHASVAWTPAGILLGLTSTALAFGLAALAVTRPHRTTVPGWSGPLRRLQSGHIGDYVAWLLVGATLLGALTVPALL